MTSGEGRPQVTCCGGDPRVTRAHRHLWAASGEGPPRVTSLPHVCPTPAVCLSHQTFAKLTLYGTARWSASCAFSQVIKQRRANASPRTVHALPCIHKTQLRQTNGHLILGTCCSCLLATCIHESYHEHACLGSSLIYGRTHMPAQSTTLPGSFSMWLTGR